VPARLQTLILLCLASVPASPAHSADQWFLMARHGECAKIESLKRKVPELGSVNDPQAFVALMRKNGHQVTSREMPVPAGKVYEVTVPGKELFLVFATAEVCTASGGR